MEVRANGTAATRTAGIPETSGPAALTTTMGVLALLLAAATIASSVSGFGRADLLLLFAAISAAIFLLLRQRVPAPVGDPDTTLVKDLIDSAGSAVFSIGLDMRVLYVNPAAERLLGYHASELTEWNRVEILAPGEGERLVAEMQKLLGVDRPVEQAREARLLAFLEFVEALPSSMVPSFETRIMSKSGAIVPVTLHISALRNAAGAFGGLVAVAMDQEATRRPDPVERESHERFRDLFENASEMIATLSPTGRFLYANPAWKRCFGFENGELLELESLEQLFDPEFRPYAAALFHRALDGERVERAALRHHSVDGRMLDLELSLSQRSEAGEPLAVRCVLRDVTQQKQRESRLALQLVVNQILDENVAPEVASMRILEALCVSQSWDTAIKWQVNAKGTHLEFSTAWGAPGRNTESVIEESMGLMLESGAELPGRAWKEGRTVWAADLAAIPASPRAQRVLSRKMASGWAVPVRVGNQVLAVLEFYCHARLREDREVSAALEMAAASLGQMLARTQERGRAEELSRQQQVLLDSVADGICGVDRQGIVSFANPAAGRLLGAPAEKLTGKRVHELLHGGASDGQQCNSGCLLKRVAENRKPASGEDTIFRADGLGFPAEYVLTPIMDQGRFSGSVLSFRDISQRSALDKMKDEFISTVSHELRTPLTSIRGALGLLSSGILSGVNEKAANLLRIALTNSDRLVRLINDILDLERIQSGREPLAFNPVQVADIVQQAMDGMQPVADAAGVQLIHDASQVEVQADPDRLLQVLTNLLSNAVKFSPPNSTVSVMLRPEEAGVTISVIDHGRGIPADKLESIFGRFQQVDASDSRQKGGSGLGLAICRTIVMQHAGRIWAERNPVRGSTFRVYLPYHPQPREEVKGTEAPVAQAR